MTEYLVPSLYSSLNSPGRRILSLFGNVCLPFILARSLRVTYYALILCRPFFLLLLRMFLPALVFILLRNPCFRFLRRLDGLKVGCMNSSSLSELVVSSRYMLILRRIIPPRPGQVKEFVLLRGPRICLQPAGAVREPPLLSVAQTERQKLLKFQGRFAILGLRAISSVG